ncbi:MAG TPA: metallophosphoesterase [Pirellulales bacterium]|nr:metallophosphoesterase [Pirellulales bacterium]
MKRVAWLTDIHLNFLSPEESRVFLDNVAAAEPDAVLIGGDIAEAPDVSQKLETIARSLTCPVYFVLGNHDFYFGSIRQVREDVVQVCRQAPHLVWLTAAEAIELTPTVGLCGHDGWADARLGDYERSLVMMNDYRLIEELAGVGKAARWPLLRALGDAAAEHVRRVLPKALDRYPHVVFLTHVPPLREACWYQGQISSDEWLPHFTCLAVGQALVEIMRQRPERKLTVLCGHTHSSGETWPLPNVRILTGSAEYGRPEIQQMFEFE